MQLDIQLTAERIPDHLEPRGAGLAGAWVEFRGLVRGEEGGEPIAALEYEAYAPMAEEQMRRILAALAETCPCLAARVIHRVGAVPVGEAALAVGIAARHRAEAFALLSQFMDRLKAEVPIWKVGSVRAGPAAVRAGDAVRATDCAPTPHASPRSADEVRSLLRTLCRPLATEQVALADAAGRVLREAIGAPEDQPPFDRSAVDGYAVGREDRATRFRVVDTIRAGDWRPCRIGPGEAVRIATGGALPGEALQVIMKEDVRVEGDQVVVLRRDAQSRVRLRGEDAPAGAVLVDAGTLLEAGALALLASVGATQPRVSRRPRVLHLATGNEVVPASASPGRGQVRDANSPLVAAFLASWGVSLEQRLLAEDERLLQSAIADAASRHDLVLISGGASVGEHDFTLRVLEACGYRIQVSRTTSRPGKPLIVAERDGTLALGLPGNPLAHFVCLHLHVRMALEAWSGRGGFRDFQTGFLTTDLAADGDTRETFWPALWQWEAGSAALTPLRWSSSGDLTSLAKANALIRIRGTSGRLAKGSPVPFFNTAGGL